MTQAFHTGFIAIVGRPNVGKSTLMNRILGQKLSITSHKPQTTRHRILGIKTDERYQGIYVDTPGLHADNKKAINRYMNRAAAGSLAEVDLIVFVIEAGRWTEEDEAVLGRLREHRLPVILTVNKVDKIEHKDELLPLLEQLGQRYDFVAVVPVSAYTDTNIDALEREVISRLPEGEPVFPEDQITDRSERFLAAEIIREKLMRALGKEIPYSLAVEIEQFKEEEGMLRIAALIWVERNSQKKIVIGKGGQMLKDIGSQSRVDMERLFGAKVFLQLWVKVKEGWSDNERLLGSLGYKDEH